MKNNSTFYNYDILLKEVLECANPKWFMLILVMLGMSVNGYSQKDKDIIPTVDCIKYTGNGLYQASFGYENPTKKEVIIDENGSIIKSNNGKRVAKGLNKFNPGNNTKVFTKEFSAHDYVEWKIISNGNEHTIVVNAKAAKCAPDDGFLFPVIGNGKSTDIIGQELTALCDNVFGDIPSNLIFQTKQEKVLVEIIPISNELNNVISLLRSNVFNVGNEDYLLYNSPISQIPEEFLTGLSAIDVYMDKNVLCLLNDYPLLINFARPVYPSIKHAFSDGSTGLAVSQGDATQTSDIVRESFKLIDRDGHVLPVDGTGITIGVISNSYNTQSVSGDNLSRAAIDVKQGDLPGTGEKEGDNNPNGYLTNVEVLNEYPEELSPADSDEGRAMMHIIHDVAPGAKLAFYAASLSPRKFEEGFKALAVDSDIIVDDITFITEPFFGEGKISEAINTFTNNGGMHFTSAGNFADHGYQGVFKPSTSIPTTNFIDANSPTRAHLFDGSGDYLQKISVVPGTYMIALQWKENAASQDNEDGSLEDLDIYVVDDFGRLLVGSNRVNVKGDPTEVIVFRATGSGEANILITSANGATSVPFRYIAFQSNGLTLMEYNGGAPTISGHAMTEASVTVGAIRFNKTEPESFSSFGGALPDDSSALVDFAAPDGVNTNVISIGTRFYADGTPIDDDDYPNFFGTSASAPSAAAAVALLQSALPTWYPDATNSGKSIKTVEDVINLFKDNAKGGVSSTQAGAGMIDANKVFNSLAAQTGRITSFVFVPETASDSASITTVTIKIIGEFLPVLETGDTYNPNLETSEDNKPVVYLDGVPIAYTVGIDGEFLAKIPPFSGNPNLQIYTAPKENSEGNGGFSEPYPFFQDGKNILTVTAAPLKIKFGEEYKSKLTYTIEGIELLDDETYPEAITRLGFPDISLSAGYDESIYLDVKNYTVTPSFDEGNFRDTDGDGVFDVYDQCPDTLDSAPVDENGCSDAQKGAENFTPGTTYKVNFKGGNLAIEKNNLVIRPKNVENATYGEKTTVELEYSGYGTTNDAGVESFGLINNPEVFLAKIKEEHLKDFYIDEATGITPIGLINNFKLGTALDPLGVDRYDDILELLEHGSWIASENTFLNRLEQMPYRGGSYLEDAGYAERAYGAVNTNLGSGFINFNPHDFTAYLDYFNPEGSTLNGQSIGIVNGQALGIINGQALGIINGQAIGIINGRALGIINGQAIGIINGQAIGIVNGQAFGIVNGQAFGIVNGQAFGIINGQAFGIINNDSGLNSGTDTNDYDKVFSIIDITDYPEPCLTSGNCTISKYYALNLITGVEVTNSNSNPQYIFPGSFINPMSDNFNIIYQKSELTIAKKGLTVSIPNFTIEYGNALTKARLLDPTTVFDGWSYGEDIATYFADDEQPFEFVKEGKIYQIGELKDLGDYTIVLKALDNYTIGYPEGDYGILTIAPATLTFTAQELEINYGKAPVIAPSFVGFADGEDEAVLKVNDEIPYYFMKDGETFTMEQLADMNIGVYNIFITDAAADNYTFDPSNNLGTLKITEAPLTFNTQELAINYGEAPVIVPNFDGFGHGEDEAVLKVNDEIPYYFKKDGDAITVYNIGDKMDVGDYEIFITDDEFDNYTFDPSNNLGMLKITKAPLTFDTQELEINYGKAPVIVANFTGIADGEDEDVLKVDDEIPYYFMKDGETFTTAQLANMNVGVYNIFITDDADDNYTFDPSNNLGTLKITEAPLTFDTQTLTITYGDTPELLPSFDGFGHGEDEAVLKVNDEISYYFMKDGETFTMAHLADMNVGDYEIFITDNEFDNYTFDPSNKLGVLTINKATLYVTISGKLIVNQFDTPALSITFDSGYAYEEGVNDVFPTGIPYEFEEEEYGEIFLDTSVPGVFRVRITDPTNYEMAYNNDAILYINPFNEEIQKIRTYADCVKHNDNRPGTYTVTYRYENDNADAVFTALGDDNNLSGPAASSAEGKLPTIFMPGSGTFEIIFNGDQLVWSLTTYDGTHKSSVSSASTSDTGVCDAKLDGAYKIYPNPFEITFNIQQNIIESSKVDIYNMYGSKVIDGPSLIGDFAIKTIDMGHLPDGLYIIRIVSATGIRTFNILKQK